MLSVMSATHQATRGIEKQGDEYRDQRPPKKCCSQHPQRFRFVPINPEHEHQVQRDWDGSADESDEQSDWPSLNADQQENDQSEQ